MKLQESFFTLMHNEAAGIGKYCVYFVDDLRIKDKLPSNITTELFLKELNDLTLKLSAIDDEHPEDVPLDLAEAITLQLVIAYTLEFFDSYIKWNDEQPERNANYEEIINIFEYLREEAPGIMLRLTEALDYNTLGVDSLENVLEIKTGVVRPLIVDNEEIVTTITVDEVNAMLLKVIFSVIDMLEMYKDKYSFAKDLYRNQFMNMTDYTTLREKILNDIIPGNEIKLTLYDNIILFWASSIIQRVFISDAADVFNNMTKKLSMDQFKRIRTIYFQFNDMLHTKMNETLSDNETFKYYTAQVSNWKFEF